MQASRMWVLSLLHIILMKSFTGYMIVYIEKAKIIYKQIIRKTKRV